jgi:hypothetical protein
MIEVIKSLIPFIAPVIISAGAGFAAYIVNGKKINSDFITKKIEEYCSNCKYKKLSQNTEMISKEMAISTRALIDLGLKFKNDFLIYIVEKKIVDKEKVLEINTYFLMLNTYDSAKEKVLDQLRMEFTRDDISKLSSFEIQNRSELLWNIITEIFDKYYKTNEKPGRIELYDLFDQKKDRYINLLSRIYEESKDLI